ncbi:MAG: TIGR03915 family putative DNA repair protein [Campylobacterales bacterium]|nr:TIGR03915 family putative DNA repair protein [Campylobacterales bacterium]
MKLVYDGTFEGFLSLIYSTYYEKYRPQAIYKEMPTSLFKDEYIEIVTDTDKAQKVFTAMKKKFHKKYMQTIANIFMCDQEDFELDLLHYTILGFKDQTQLENINIQSVFKINTLQKEFFHVHHKMTGFLRFEEIEDGTLYARLETKCNVVYSLAKHFLKRFNNQNFIIHDIQRKIAFVKNESFTGVKEVAKFDTPNFSQTEEKFQELWKTFFRSVSIAARENKRAQRQFVPFVYRIYMSEF